MLKDGNELKEKEKKRKQHSTSVSTSIWWVPPSVGE